MFDLADGLHQAAKLLDGHVLVGPGFRHVQVVGQHLRLLHVIAYDQLSVLVALHDLGLIRRPQPRRQQAVAHGRDHALLDLRAYERAETLAPVNILQAALA